MNPVTSSLSLPFGASSGDGSLSWSLGGLPVRIGDVPLTLADTITGAHELHTFSTVGTLNACGRVVKKVEKNFQTLSGSESLTLPQSGVGYRVLVAMDDSGSRINPSITMASDGRTIKFGQKVWGLIQIDGYDQSCVAYDYAPALISGVVTYGLVAAFKAGQASIFQVPMSTYSYGQDEFEIYRVESKTLINDKGAWEMPTGWPNNPSYPNGATPPKPKVGVTTSRVHEIGMISLTGYFYSRTYDPMIYQPYFGDRNYNPQKSVVQGNGMSKIPDSLKARAQQIIAERGKAQYL